MDIQLLKDPEVYPSDDILETALGKVYSVLKTLQATFAENKFALTFAWHYYNDGKAWLCKVSFKKKTVFWLSAWENYFRISLFFLERHVAEIANLNINETIKENFCKTKVAGKLLPMIFNISQNEQLGDLLKVIQFKMTTK